MLYNWPGVYLNLTLPMPGEENPWVCTLCRIAFYVHVKSYPFIRFSTNKKNGNKSFTRSSWRLLPIRYLCVYGVREDWRLGRRLRRAGMNKINSDWVLAEEQLAERVWRLNPNPHFRLYFRLSGFQSSLLLFYFRHGWNTRYPFTLRRRVAQKPTRYDTYHFLDRCCFKWK